MNRVAKTQNACLSGADQRASLLGGGELKEEERDHGGLQREWLESDIYPDVLLKLTCSIYSLSLSVPGVPILQVPQAPREPDDSDRPGPGGFVVLSRRRSSLRTAHGQSRHPRRHGSRCRLRRRQLSHFGECKARDTERGSSFQRLSRSFGLRRSLTLGFPRCLRPH